MRQLMFAAGVFVALALCIAARAETVVLADGTSLEGQVSTHNGRVTIVTADGTLTLPADKVRLAGKAPAPKPAVAPAPKAPQTPAPAAPAAAPGPKAPQPAAAPSLARAMGQKIDVAFEGVAPAEAFDYLRQITNLNLVIDSDVRADTQTVTLNLHDVPLAGVLDLLKEMNGYTYELRPGQILFVRKQAAPGAYVMRIYNVTDLLVSTEDTGTGPLSGNGQGAFGTGGSNTRGSNTGGRSSLGQGLSPQFAPTPAGAATITGTGANGGSGPSAGNGPYAGTLPARAQDLALLIANTCGRGSWAQPAVIAP